jgi:hypothetical protein
LIDFYPGAAISSPFSFREKYNRYIGGERTVLLSLRDLHENCRSLWVFKNRSMQAKTYTYRRCCMSIISEHYSNEKIYNLPQAANEAGVAKETIRAAIKKGELPAQTISFGTKGRVKYMVAETDLLNWVEKRPSLKEERKNKVAQTRSISDLTIEELGGELLNKIKLSYDEGYKKGFEDARKMILEAVKGVKA